jgi:uncharacterized protein YprB with RNaseH-like and TPR domain
MLEDIKLESILFLDIETVSQFPDFESLPIILQKHWDRKSRFFRKETETAADVYSRAGIYAEFGQIICISVGYIKVKNEHKVLRIKSFSGDDEKDILIEFINLLNKSYQTPEHLLCAHNGKEFDFPYIARRILVNGLKLPKILDIAGKKPWEIKHLDTLELWKFGDYKHYTSLELLTTIFNIPTSKDDIDGSEVGEIYWIEKDLNRVVKYCRKDVIAIVQLFLRYKGDDLIREENIEIAD